MVNHITPRALTMLVLWACLAAMLAGATACAGSTNAASSGSGASSTPSSSGSDSTSGTGSTSSTDTTTGTGSAATSDGTSGSGTTGTTPTPPAPGTAKTGALFRTYSDAKDKYSVLVPGGWLSRHVPTGVLFARFGSTEAIRVIPGATAPSAKKLDAQLASQKTLGHALNPDKARVIKFANGHTAVVIDFERKPPKPLPGGQTLLTVREYAIKGTKKAALVFLTSPKGVQNTVAYDLIASSFRWR
jgi:hypothetical protein